MNLWDQLAEALAVAVIVCLGIYIVLGLIYSAIWTFG
jgi:hypothetical protein